MKRNIGSFRKKGTTERGAVVMGNTCLFGFNLKWIDGRVSLNPVKE
jgi:hypothetical protein